MKLHPFWINWRTYFRIHVWTSTYGRVWTKINKWNTRENYVRKKKKNNHVYAHSMCLAGEKSMSAPTSLGRFRLEANFWVFIAFVKNGNSFIRRSIARIVWHLAFGKEWVSFGEKDFVTGSIFMRYSCFFSLQVMAELINWAAFLSMADHCQMSCGSESSN